MTPVAGAITLLIATGSGAYAIAVVAAAIVLLGPGAYSIDARIFGRREIVINRYARKRRRRRCSGVPSRYAIRPGTDSSTSVPAFA
jgi:hypothetical protein